MQLTDRYLCEGTCPKITIGHRVYRKPNGDRYVARPWTAQWSFEGKSYTEALGTNLKKVAIRKAYEIQARIHEGQLKPKKFKLSIEALRSGYLEQKINENASTRTVEKYTFTLSLLVEWAEGQRKTSAVSFNENEFWAFSRFCRDRGDGDATVYGRLVLVKQAFKWAHREGLLPENRLARPKLRKPAPTEQPCFTAEQISQLLEIARPREAAIFATMAYLGLRIGEVRDLRWQDILWDRGQHGVVTVRRGGSNNTTKSRRVRRIPLHAELGKILKTLPHDFERVFTNAPSPRNPLGGAPIKPDWLRLHLKKLCRQCDFDKPDQYKLHTFRHTFASMCARNNVSYKYALEWMGHTDSQILDLYYTQFDDMADTAMKTIQYPNPKKEEDHDDTDRNNSDG